MIIVVTKYKRKDKKILPQNVSLSNDINSNDEINESIRILKIEDDDILQNSSSDSHFRDKIVSHESHLIFERFVNMQIDIDFLSISEKQLFIDILFEFEDVIVFENS